MDDGKKGVGVSIVIPARNEPLCVHRAFTKRGGSVMVRPETRENHSWVMETVLSARAGLPEAEIIVVDDASCGENKNCCAGIVGKGLADRLITNDRNMGVGASRNIGIAAAKYDNLIVEDSHVTQKEPDALGNLIYHAIQDNSFAVCYAHTDISEKPKNGGHFIFMRGKYLGWQYGAPTDADRFPIQVPNGGCYAFTRELYDHLQLWPTLDGTFGHNPVTKGLMCYFTDTRAIVYKDAPIYHRYGGIGYSFDTRSQWFNACRAYAVIFSETTYKSFWRPILGRVLGIEHVDRVWADPKVTEERERFAPKKKHTDAEFFRECLDAPCVDTDGGVTFVPRVSIIVPGWNEHDRIAETCKSIRESTKFDPDIIVIDDGSDTPYKDLKVEASEEPKTLQQFIMETAENPPEGIKGKAGNRRGVILHRNPKRLGLPASRNIGLGIAEKLGAHIGMLSDGHVIWTDETVMHLSESAEETGGIVAASFANWSDHPDEAVKKVYGADLVLRKSRGLGASYIRKEPDADLSPVKHIIGSVYAFKMDTMRKLGGFYELPIEGAWWGCAEALLTLRCFFWGIPIHVDKRSFVKHMLHKDRTVPSEPLKARMALLHLIAFTPSTYLNIFRPALKGWNREGSGERVLPDYYLSQTIKFSKRKVKTEREFFETYLPELLPQWLKLGIEDEQLYPDWQKSVSGALVVELPATENLDGWEILTCCNRQPNAMIARLGNKTFMMLGANMPQLQEFRTICISDIKYCPFCDNHVSLDEAKWSEPGEVNITPGFKAVLHNMQKNFTNGGKDA